MVGADHLDADGARMRAVTRARRRSTAMIAVATLAASITAFTPAGPGDALDGPFTVLQAEAGDLAFVDGTEIDADGVRHVVLDSPVGPRRGPAPCSGRRVRPADDLDDVVNAAAPGTVFCLDPGLHRIDAPLVMKDGQQLRGAGPDTVITGARTVRGWRAAETPGQWVAEWLPGRPWEPSSPCDNGVVTCNESTDVFVDDEFLTRVASRGAVAGRRSFIDYDRRQIVIGVDPTDRTVEASRQLKFGIVDREESDDPGNADGVVLDNFVIEKLGTRAQYGAIDAKSSWQVTNVEVRSVHGVGIRGPVGPDSRVERTYVHDIGQLGMGGTRLDGGYGPHEPIYYVGNEITRTNYAGYRHSWETGGAKWTQLNGLVLRDNFIHDGAHVGIWIDVNVKNAVIERNVVTNNETRGVFFEISCNATIRDNVIRNNGTHNGDGRMRNAGILIVASGDPDVQTVVSGNVIDRNGDGIGLLQRKRTDRPGACSTERTTGNGTTEYIHRLQNVLVTDNDITLLADTRSRTGIGRYAGNVYGGNYRFTGNRYRLVDPDDARFEFGGGLLDFAAWRATGGQDAGGSIRSYRSSAPCDTPIQDAPTAALTASVDTGGDHQIWIRMRSPDRYNNSVFLTVDDACPVVVGDDEFETTPGAWQWVRASTQAGAGVFDLASGPHGLDLIRNEEGVAIDKVAIIRDGSDCRPDGAGVTCGDAADDPPVWTPLGDRTSYQDVAVRLDLAGMVTDPEGRPLTISATNLPEGLRLTGDVIVGTPVRAGVSSVTLTATDGGSSASTTFRWTIRRGALVLDEFDRTVARGWGGATIGGTWAAPTTSPHGDYSVSAGHGRVDAAARTARRADLDVSVRDVVVHAEFGVEELPSPTRHARLWVVARAQDQSTQYRARVIVDSAGVAKLALTRNTGGGDQVIGGQVLIDGLGNGLGPADMIAVEMEVVGAAPTTIRAKSWVVGTPEPANWMREADDRTSALQVAGRAGVRVWGTERFTALVDRIEVREHGAGSPPQPVNQDPGWLPVADRADVEGTAVDPVDLGAFAVDPDGDPLVFTASGLPDGLTISASGVVTGSPSAAGAYTPQVTATDPEGVSASVGFGWVVEPPPEPPSTSFVVDEFDRTGSGWQSADIGGTWATSGGGFSTAAGRGVVATSSGMRRASLPVAADDVEIRSVVSFDDLPSTRAHFAWLTARSSGDANEYRARLRLMPDGSLRLALTAKRSGGGETLLADEIVVTDDYSPGAPIEVRFELSDGSPTTLRAAAWVGEVESGWTTTATDSTPGLQDAGEVGVRVVSFAPTVVRWERLEAGPPGSL